MAMGACFRGPFVCPIISILFSFWQKNPKIRFMFSIIHCLVLVCAAVLSTAAVSSSAASPTNIDTNKAPHVARLAMITLTNNIKDVLWTAGINERFSTTPPGAARKLCGAFPISERIKELLKTGEAELAPSYHGSNTSLPTDFDPVQKWPQCKLIINDIRDQSNCGKNIFILVA